MPVQPDVSVVPLTHATHAPAAQTGVAPPHAVPGISWPPLHDHGVFPEHPVEIPVHATQAPLTQFGVAPEHMSGAGQAGIIPLVQVTVPALQELVLHGNV